MRVNNRSCKPLLRGCLVGLTLKWFPSPDGEHEHKEATIAVWCPFCKRFHTHGWDPANDGRYAEHRTAHCSDDSPFHVGGYYISTWRKSDPEYAGHVVKPGVAIVRKVALPQADRARELADSIDGVRLASELPHTHATAADGNG